MALHDEALAAWQRGEARAARDLFRRALPLPVPCLLPAAQCEWRSGDHAAALALFRAAHAAQPLAAMPRVALAQALVSLGETGEARSLLAGPAAPLSPGEPALAEFLAAVWALDDRPPPASLGALRAVASRTPFGEALAAVALMEAWLAEVPPPPMSWPSAMGQARWDSLRLRYATPRPRLFGTAAGLRRAAEAAATVEGLVCEFGVYQGLSLRQWQPGSDGRVHGFDSFQGLPEAWTDADGAGAYSTGGEIPALPGHARLWVGWFADCLPGFMADCTDPIRLLHIDCDVYRSTVDVLEGLATRMVPGTVVVFDDYDGYPGFEGHERRAWLEFLTRHGRSAEVLGHVFFGREAAFRLR